MQLAPVDLVGLVATIMGISIVLIPVIGLTARFALKPTVEALSRFFDHQGLEDTVKIMERRMQLMEQQIESMDRSVQRVAEATEFQAALGAPREPSPEAPPTTEAGAEDPRT